jgi:hypothetical protein
MLYSVEDAAIKLSVSKMTIYNKIKLKEYKDKVIKKAGKTYIDDTLLNLIKDSLKSKSPIESNNIEDTTKQEVAADTADLLNLNKDLFNALMEQLHQKDMQIQSLTDRLRQEQELHQNTQVLFKQQIPQDIKQLEEHFKIIDGFIDTWRQDHREPEKKKGFFKLLFK